MVMEDEDLGFPDAGGKDRRQVYRAIMAETLRALPLDLLFRLSQEERFRAGFASKLVATAMRELGSARRTPPDWLLPLVTEAIEEAVPQVLDEAWMDAAGSRPAH
ncbi:hypothetical protein [Paracraurococcus ruber]|uniref:DUF2267 domain-containing protein n=1 Tax=Paracraurococcus ruber TaxID=77675 RepID=A0ABS1D6B0_9PROT|nr:hypothetical protein [Paracraurococcus ruber]MBK1662005.1 hypothetical protein [Paracraurococcus ruber]TDG16487.1 hypothetical protein E2C05_29180 [Paracraurococcus ruber]